MTFRVQRYPDEKRFATRCQRWLTEKDRELMQLYRLVYCVDCAVPVYWMGLGERTRVERIKL